MHVQDDCTYHMRSTTRVEPDVAGAPDAPRAAATAARRSSRGKHRLADRRTRAGRRAAPLRRSAASNLRTT
eukprot:3262978-Pleurochrysis_carterae.AAC.1